mmetsp:Transcript_41999/g.130796  ORF Transcript_41999/g.130796 Transcript_41999/m.130796 type:complete len:712 (+) Transcript_41999:138-2273(+)
MPQPQLQAAPQMHRVANAQTLQPAPPPMPAQAASSPGFVFMCGHPADWMLDDLFGLLSRHLVATLLDARPAASTVPLVRRSCAAQGIAYDEKPLLGNGSPGADAGAKAAVLAHLAAQARQASAGGPKPCVLFSGEAWRLCKSRCSLADELEARGIQVFHIVWGSGELERHRGTTPAVPSSSPRSPTSPAWHSRAPLQVSVIPPKDGTHVGTLVYLHALGFGTAPYTNQMRTYAMDGIRIVLPCAPQLAVARYGGRQMLSWYDFAAGHGGQGGQPEDHVDENSLAQTRAQILELVESEAKLLGDGGRARLLLGGLSQGCSAALDAALQAQEPVGGFVGVAGRALRSTPSEGPARMKLHFFFGMQEDDGTPWHYSEQSLSRFRAHHDVQIYGPFPNVGRYVPAATEAEWLRNACRTFVDAAAVAAVEAAAAVARGRRAAQAEEASMFEVTLQKGSDSKLGMQLDCSDTSALVIKSVGGGIVGAWNAQHPGRELKVGDRVLEVNGISGNIAHLVHECRRGQQLRMKLQRGGEAAGGQWPACPAPGEAAATGAAGATKAALAVVPQPRLARPPKRGPQSEPLPTKAGLSLDGQQLPPQPPPPASRAQVHQKRHVMAPRSKARPARPARAEEEADWPVPPPEPPPERLLQAWGLAVPTEEEGPVEILSDGEEEATGGWAEATVDIISDDECQPVPVAPRPRMGEAEKRRRMQQLEL